MLSLMYAWINVWVYNREAGDLRRSQAYYDVIVMDLAHRIQLQENSFTITSKEIAMLFSAWTTVAHLIKQMPVPQAI